MKKIQNLACVWGKRLADDPPKSPMGPLIYAVGVMGDF